MSYKSKKERRNAKKRKPLEPQKDLWQQKETPSKPKTIIRKKGEVERINQEEYTEDQEAKRNRKAKNKQKKKNKKQSRKALQSQKMKEWQEKKGIHEYADNLRENLPESEKWFLSELKKLSLGISFESNFVLGFYIPDFIYRELIIEIDDPTHNTPQQKHKDKQKDIYYKSLGYKVIRVTAWDQTSFNECIKQVKSYQAELRQPKKINKNDVVTKKQWKKEQAKKRSTYTKYKKNLCSICKKESGTAIIKYSSKTFKVCEKCKKDHERLMQTKEAR